MKGKCALGAGVVEGAGVLGAALGLVVDTAGGAEAEERGADGGPPADGLDDAPVDRAVALAGAGTDEGTSGASVADGLVGVEDGVEGMAEGGVLDGSRDDELG
jgi:hypothetical protein